MCPFISSDEMCYMATAPSLGFLCQTAADPQPTAEATIKTSALRGFLMFLGRTVGSSPREVRVGDREPRTVLIHSLNPLLTIYLDI